MKIKCDTLFGNAVTLQILPKFKAQFDKDGIAEIPDEIGKALFKREQCPYKIVKEEVKKEETKVDNSQEEKQPSAKIGRPPKSAKSVEPESDSVKDFLEKVQ